MAKIIRLFPVILSAIVLAAHFLRAGNLILVLASLAAGALVLLRRPWIPRIMQIGLILAALEWVRTLVILVQQRQSLHQPWDRLAIILALVALLTASSALVFRSPVLREYYSRRLDKP